MQEFSDTYWCIIVAAFINIYNVHVKSLEIFLKVSFHHPTSPLLFSIQHIHTLIHSATLTTPSAGHRLFMHSPILPLLSA